MRYLVNEPVTTIGTTHTNASSSVASALEAKQLRNFFQGYGRLWRGVQVSLIGCIPADGLYFCSYEAVKSATADKKTGQVTAWGSSLAGAAAVLSHDVIMTPLDTMKQRMQLGHYPAGGLAAFRSILQTEGWKALYVSLPITLVTNIPYGMVMVSTHESCKHALSSDNRPAWQTVLLASSFAGAMAAAITTPLDRIKTALQTKELTPVCHVEETTSQVLRQEQATRSSIFPPRRISAGAPSSVARVARHATWWDAAARIYRAEGIVGFARGLVPRILSHTPAVAIGWTTYETVKHALFQYYQYNCN
jgi:solute carrier family 25 (mitochondrial iron transporter), member 28/37